MSEPIKQYPSWEDIGDCAKKISAHDANRRLWAEVLVSLCAHSFSHKEEDWSGVMVILSVKDMEPQKLLGHKGGVVFSPAAVLELMSSTLS